MDDDDSIEGLEARLPARGPEASDRRIESMSRKLKDSERRPVSRLRKAVAIAFASLMLGSVIIGVALPGNQPGTNGKGNGDGGIPDNCVEGNGKAPSHNTFCT
jgi:hypothetical protein